MSKLFNRAKMTTATTGTGNLTLGSAASGFVTFATAGVVNGDKVRYCIEAENGTDFEIGEGSYTASGTVLSRADADVQLSSNSNNRITLAAGTHNVFITAADSDFTQEIIVTVVNAGAGNKYVIDGTSQQIITLLPSITYRLDQSDSTNATHPLVLASGSADGSTYSTGVRVVGTPGSKGSYTEVKLEQDAPALFYKCSNHAGMGNSINLAAPVAGAASAVGALTKTFTQNEEASITLSSAISPVPNVSVFKEVAQAGLSSKGSWDVNSTASNYTRLDEATSVTLTPSAVGDGTFTLGSGSFATADIGKTITGNGGVALITSAAGAYTTSTDFTNTNAIAAGSWDLHGSVPKSDGSGLSISGNSTHFPASQYFPSVTAASGQIDTSAWSDINSMTADEAAGNGTLSYAVSTDNHTTWSVAKGTSGVRKIAKNNSGTWQYNNNAGALITVSDVSNATVDTGNLSGDLFSAAGVDWANMRGVVFNNTGTKLFLSDFNSDNVDEFPVGTAWDMTTVGTKTATLTTGGDFTTGLRWGNKAESGSANGTRIFASNYGEDKVKQFDLSTAYDLSSASNPNEEFYFGTQAPTSFGMDFKPDGTKMYVSSNNNVIYQYSLSTSWDVTSASYDNVSATVSSHNGITFNLDGTRLFMGSGRNIKMQVLATAWDLSTLQTATTLDVSGAITNASGIGYSSFFKPDGSQLFMAFKYGGVLGVNVSSSGFDTSETWVNGANNNELYTLQEALAAQAFNRMNKAQLDAISDANHFPLGNTLDLMIAPYLASGATAPLSDGVTINYDGAALVKKAVNGTDYEAEFPSSTSVKIKSLAAHNLKIRVL